MPNILVIYWILLTLLSYSYGSENSYRTFRHKSSESRLHDYLTANYTKNRRPVLDLHDPVHAQLGITLVQILDLVERDQTLVSNIWMDQYWNDCFLKWNPDNFGGLKETRISSNEIWHPDTVLYNNAGDMSAKRLDTLAMIFSNGDVFSPIPVRTKTSCEVDVTYFPFDTQSCDLQFTSWTYSGRQLNLTIHVKDIDLKNYVSNGEWELLRNFSQLVIRNVSTDNDDFYPELRFTFIIKRRILYYACHIIYPCVLMSCMTILVFWLPPDSGEKVGLGVSVFLTFFVLMLAIAEKLPKTSDSVPIISVFLTIVTGMSSLSIILACVVLSLHYVDDCYEHVLALNAAIRVLKSKPIRQLENFTDDMHCLDEICLLLSALDKQSSANRKCDDTLQQWRELSVKVDRWLLYIALLATGICCIVTLVLIPFIRSFASL